MTSQIHRLNNVDCETKMSLSGEKIKTWKATRGVAEYCQSVRMYKLTKTKKIPSG